MLPTPSTSHVDFDQVYEPAEDSFVLLDTLSSPAEISFLTARFGENAQSLGPHRNSLSPLIVEIGTGSGVVLAFITANSQKLFGRTDILSLGVDINPFACQATVRTVEQACLNGHHKPSRSPQSGLLLAILNADLAKAIRPETVDVIIFNPPYVPTECVPQPPILQVQDITEQRNSSEGAKMASDTDFLSLSYAGGVDGMEITAKLLERLPDILTPDRGVAYILLCKQNNPLEVVQSIKRWGSGWAIEIVGSSGKIGGWERLQVIRISRTSA